MVVLDFVPRPGWDVEFTETEMLSLDEVGFVDAALPAELTFVVNGVDLSWHEWIPMLQFARDFWAAAVGLSEEAPEAEFIVFDLIPVVRLRWIAGDDVLVRRDGIDATARCGRRELVVSCARFAVRVYDHFIAAYPVAVRNAALRAWYRVSRDGRNAARVTREAYGDERRR